MLPHVPPPPSEILVAPAAVPLLPGSDPLMLGTYRWTLAHSPSLQKVVRQLAAAERKARYRLVPGLNPNFGGLLVRVTPEAYEIDLQVSMLAWSHSGDALEPWVATTLFLALEAASKGKLKETGDPQHLHFLDATKQAAFAFQDQVRKELALADPERLKDLPNGARLFELGFRPLPKAPGVPAVPVPRAIPPGVQ